MKRCTLIVLAAALFLGAVSHAGSEGRLDFDIPILIAAGINVSDLTNNSSVDVDLSSYHLPLPYVELAYQFGTDELRGGVGLRSYTLLVEFAGWPMGYVEAEFDRLVLRAELGGLAFFLLGVYNDFKFSVTTMVPDLQVSYAIAPWFRLGAGVLAVAPLDTMKNFGWLFYINGRFVLTFK